MDFEIDLFSHFDWDEDHATQALEAIEREREVVGLGASRYVYLYIHQITTPSLPHPCSLAHSDFLRENEKEFIASWPKGVPTGELTVI